MTEQMWEMYSQQAGASGATDLPSRLPSDVQALLDSLDFDALNPSAYTDLTLSELTQMLTDLLFAQAAGPKQTIGMLMAVILLCALFGGVISGIGSGIAIRFGGAMDGIEVLAVIFAKSLGITVGTFVMIYNVLLYVICGLVLGSWILPLYSIVTYAAALKTIDFIVDGLDRAKCAIIIVSAHKNLRISKNLAFLHTSIICLSYSGPSSV